MKRRNKKGGERRAPVRVPKRGELAAPPGVVAAADRETDVRLGVLRYDAVNFDEKTFRDPEELADIPTASQVCWVDVEGVGQPGTLETLARVFDWHALVLEDVLSLHQRPKVEEYDDYVYVVLLMPSGPDGLPLEQLSMIIGDHYVVTVQAGLEGDTLENVRERLRRSRGRIRSLDADYLAYALIDAVVDHYFPIAETLNDRLEAIEESLIAADDKAAIEDIHSIRNDLHTIRRAVWATGEAIGRLVRGEAGQFAESTRVYLRDCQDHCAQLLDTVEACHELSSSLMQLHQSALNNQMNEGMRILTMIATIFIPMSFIAGVYGMNFDRTASAFNMPELSWPYGYPFALGLMLVVGLVFVTYFRRRGWLGNR